MAAHIALEVNEAAQPYRAPRTRWLAVPRAWSAMASPARPEAWVSMVSFPPYRWSLAMTTANLAKSRWTSLAPTRGCAPYAGAVAVSAIPAEALTKRRRCTGSSGGAVPEESPPRGAKPSSATGHLNTASNAARCRW